MGDVLYIVMPAYNESANIEKVVRSWYRNVENKAEGSKLLVADNGSNDGTHEKLLALMKELPRLSVLENTDRQHGPKCIALYKAAVNAGADYVFQTDSDGQTDPAQFPMFWRQRKNYDAIFAYRPQREDGLSRVFTERVLVLLLRIIFGVKLPDANAPFRLFNCKVLEKYLPYLPDDYFLPNVMLCVFYKAAGEQIAYKSIHFRARAGGENSIDFLRIFKIGLKSISDFLHFKRVMREDMKIG